MVVHDCGRLAASAKEGTSAPDHGKVAAHSRFWCAQRGRAASNSSQHDGAYGCSICLLNLKYDIHCLKAIDVCNGLATGGIGVKVHCINPGHSRTLAPPAIDRHDIPDKGTGEEGSWSNCLNLHGG